MLMYFDVDVTITIGERSSPQTSAQTHMFPELNYCLHEKNNNTREMIGLGPIGSDQSGMFYVLSIYELCMLVN